MCRLCITRTTGRLTQNPQVWEELGNRASGRPVDSSLCASNSIGSPGLSHQALTSKLGNQSLVDQAWITKHGLSVFQILLLLDIWSNLLDYPRVRAVREGCSPGRRLPGELLEIRVQRVNRMVGPPRYQRGAARVQNPTGDGLQAWSSSGRITRRRSHLPLVRPQSVWGGPEHWDAKYAAILAQMFWLVKRTGERGVGRRSRRHTETWRVRT
jgi:hypothetical protein